MSSDMNEEEKINVIDNMDCASYFMVNGHEGDVIFRSGNKYWQSCWSHYKERISTEYLEEITQGEYQVMLKNHVKALTGERGNAITLLGDLQFADTLARAKREKEAKVEYLVVDQGDGEYDIIAPNIALHWCWCPGDPEEAPWRMQYSESQILDDSRVVWHKGNSPDVSSLENWIEDIKSNLDFFKEVTGFEYDSIDEFRKDPRIMWVDHTEVSNYKKLVESFRDQL